MLEVNAANSKIVAETEEEMKDVEKYMSDIEDISHKFDFITKNGSEKQIFRLIKTLETDMYFSTSFISSSVSATIFELAALTSNMSFFSISSMCFKIRDLNISTPLFPLSVLEDISHKFDFITKNGSEKQIFRLIKTLETGLSQKSEDLEKLISSLTSLLAVSIKYLTSDAKSSNMVALLTPFAATSNGFIFPHIRCSSEERRRNI
jgi:hypothetical protein